MRMTVFVLLAVLLGMASAQQTWVRNYGGPGYDAASCAEPTPDGGYIVVGGTNDTLGSNPDIWLAKLDAYGDTLWTRTYSGAGVDAGEAVLPTPDGGYIIAGWTTSYGNSEQVYLIKTDAIGTAVWSRTYGGTGHDQAWSIALTADSGYIVAGSTSSYGDSGQVYLIKTDANGDSLWSRAFGGARGDWAQEVRQTPDSGYIAIGTSTSFGDGNLQVYLIKTFPSGNPEWSKVYGGADPEYGYSVEPTRDGGYLCAGTTGSFGNSSQAYLIKTNAYGDTLWTRTYGLGDCEEARSVRQTPDSGCILAGYTASYGDSEQVYLVKTNAAGDTLWTRTHGGTGRDFANSVRVAPDGGYVIAGSSSSFGNRTQAYLIKTEQNGTVAVADRLPSVPRVRAGRSTIARGVLRWEVDGSQQTGDGGELLDASGRRVMLLHPGPNDVRALAPGVYFISTGGASRAGSARVVLLR